MWDKLICILAVGYLSFGRPFAYIGIPPLKIFIGELTLAGLILFRNRETIDRWAEAIVRPGELHYLSVSILVLIADGAFEVLRGVAAGYPLVRALQNLVFNVYPLFIFAGIWMGSVRPDLLRRIAIQLAWVNGVYGFLYLVLLSKFQVMVPGTNPPVPLFGQPNGSAYAIAGLLCAGVEMRLYWPLFMLNAFVMLGIQVRAEFLAMLVGLILWGTLSHNLSKVAATFACIAALVAIGFVTDFSIPAPQTRGGAVSARYIVGRVIAPIDRDLAADLTPLAKGNAETVEWRTNWWKAIWATVNRDTETALFGLGYGFPLSSLVTYIRDEVIRTPHNAFFYSLGYCGWLGVGIVAAFQAALCRLLWKTFQATGEAYGLVFWVMSMCGALFGDLLEAPFGAIPLYLISGLAAGKYALRLRRQSYYARVGWTQLLPVTGR